MIVKNAIENLDDGGQPGSTTNHVITMGFIGLFGRKCMACVQNGSFNIIQVMDNTHTTYRTSKYNHERHGFHSSPRLIASSQSPFLSLIYSFLSSGPP